jgi:hypothetical protein
LKSSLYTLQTKVALSHKGIALTELRSLIRTNLETNLAIG